MQSTHKITGSAAAGFAAYLTTSASRGDYYVGGELEGDGGAWHGSPEALGELGLDPTQTVAPFEARHVDGGPLAGDRQAGPAGWW